MSGECPACHPETDPFRGLPDITPAKHTCHRPEMHVVPLDPEAVLRDALSAQATWGMDDDEPYDPRETNEGIV